MITVLMPTYNCVAYIGDAIRSILNQTYIDFEFLLIDDGSTDETDNIIAGFNDERIKYIKLSHSGIVHTLNYGLSQANYDLIGIMHADDIAHPDWLKESISIRNSNLELDIISCWYVCFLNNSIKYIVQTPEDHESISRGLILYSLISHPGCTFSRKKILSNSRSYRLEGGIEDYELWYQVKDKLKFCNIQKPLIFYRLRKNSLSRNNLMQYNKIVYTFQSRFYDKLDSVFGISNSQALLYRGWREYFYGSKNEARKIWMDELFKSALDYRIILAFLVTYLPEKTFQKFKEQRVRFKLNYICTYFSFENKNLRKILKSILKID